MLICFLIFYFCNINFECLLSRAESPSQVFLIILAFLYLLFKNVEEKDFGTYWIAYDNMCNVMRLKVANVSMQICISFIVICMKIVVGSVICSGETGNKSQARSI